MQNQSFFYKKNLKGIENNPIGLILCSKNSTTRIIATKTQC